MDEVVLSEVVARNSFTKPDYFHFDARAKRIFIGTADDKFPAIDHRKAVPSAMDQRLKVSIGDR